MNAFDFHHEIEAEEKAKKEKQDKILAARKAEAIESALIGSKQVGNGMNNMITFGAVHAAKALESQPKRIDTGEFADRALDGKRAVIMEGGHDSTTVTVGGVTATATVEKDHKFKADFKVKAIEKEAAYEAKYGKKKKKGDKTGKKEEEMDSAMKKVVLLAMKRKAREERREAREKRKLEGADMIPSGVDDGKGAQKLLTGYVDEVLAMSNAPDPLTVPDHVTEKDKFKYSSFIQKLFRPELQDIPLVSQLVTQKALKPVHTNADKKMFNDICARLKRNDGGLVRLQLNKSGVDDRVAHQLSLAIEKNIYMQMLMLHDNRVSDLGSEELCRALRWHPSVHTLWLGANPIGDRGCQALANLAHLNHNLKDLNISNRRPPKSWGGNENEDHEAAHLSITFEGAQAIAKSLRLRCQLTSLSLADQRIRDKGARAIFAALPYSFIRSLNLKNNKLSKGCCNVLRDILVTTHLQIVAPEMSVSIEGSALDFTRPSTGMQMLTDGYAPGSRGGARVVTPAGVRDDATGGGSTVVKPLTLELLDLSENLIDCDGATDLAYALSYNKVLKVLNLGKNKIGDRGIEELLACLQYNQVIRSIVTLYNTSKDERVDRVLELRTAAVQALEDHLDRAQNREDYHNTGFLVDRTGEYGSKGTGRRNSSRGGTSSPSGRASPFAGAGRGTPGSPGSGMREMQQYPTFSKAQLADYVDSKGNFGIDTGIGGPPGTASTPAQSSTPIPSQPVSPGGGNDEYNDFMAAVDTKPVTVTPGFSDTTIGILNNLAAGARELNRNPGVGAQGAPQKPIDFRQIAMPAHVVGVAESGSTHREQTFDKRARKELIPKKIRRVPPSSKGAGESGKDSAGSGASASGTPVANPSPPGSPGLAMVPISPMGTGFDFMNRDSAGFNSDTLAGALLPDAIPPGGDPKLALSNEERDILSPLPSSRSKARTSGARGSGLGFAGMPSPSRPFLLQTALTRDEDKLSSLSDIYDPERRMDSYTHLNVLKRAQTAPDGRNLHENGSSSATGNIFKSESAAKGWGLTLTGIGLGDSDDRAQRDSVKYTTSVFETKSHGGKLARPGASAGGMNSASGTKSVDIKGHAVPPRPATTGGVSGHLPRSPSISLDAGGRTPSQSIGREIRDDSMSSAPQISTAALSNEVMLSELAPGQVAAASENGVIQDRNEAISGIAMSPIKPSGPIVASSTLEQDNVRIGPTRSRSPGSSGSRSGSPSSRNLGNRLPPSRGQPLPLILKEGHDETADDAPGTLSLMNPELVTQTDPVHDNGNSFRLPPPGTPVEREYDAVAQRGDTFESFLDMFEGPDEEAARLWHDQQEEREQWELYYMACEEYEQRKQAKEERDREQARRRKKKKKKSKIDSHTRPGSSSMNVRSPLGSPASGFRKRPGSSSSSASSDRSSESDSNYESGSSAGTSPSITPVGSPKIRPKTMLSRSGSNTPKGVMTDPPGSPSTGMRRSVSFSETDSRGSSPDGGGARGRSPSNGAVRPGSSSSDALGSAPLPPTARPGSTSRSRSPVGTLKDTERLKARQELARFEATKPILTEKQRLGATLPNSPYRRYFSKEGKSIFNTDLGKTRGVPKVPPTGVRPIRSATGGYRDSGQHIGYLGIITPDDPVGARPLSLVDIAKQQQEHRAAIVADRQTEVYKELKKDALDQLPRNKQRAAALPVPEKFWTSWRRDNRLKYPNGIDRATGTTSTNISELRQFLKNKDGSVILDKDARERMKIKTPGEALAYRRKKRAEEIEQERLAWRDPTALSVGRAKKLTHDMLGLRNDQGAGDLMQPARGLTTKLETEKMRPSLGPKNKFKKPNL